MTYGWTRFRKNDVRLSYDSGKWCSALWSFANSTIWLCDDSVEWLSAIFFSAKQQFVETAFRRNDDSTWFLRFKNREISIEHQPRSGRPATSRSDENVDKINAPIREDRRRTIDQLYEMSEYLGVQFRGFYPKSCSQICPSPSHRRAKGASTSGMFWASKSAQRGPWFFSMVITGDESWCYGYDPETKQQSSQWKSPVLLVPKKPAKWSQTSRQCSFVSSIAEVLCTRSSFPRVKLLTRSCTWRF